MFKGLTVAVILLLGSAISCKTTPQTTCIDPTRINPDVMCTMQYDPVCGCDGKTYGNNCEASRAGVTTYTKGACDTKSI